MSPDVVRWQYVSGPLLQPAPLTMPSSQVATFVHVGPAGFGDVVVSLVVVATK